MQLPSKHVPRHVVAIVASLGGIAALRQVLSALPAEFPAAVLVIQHQQRGRESMLASLLASRCALPVRDARGGEVMEEGVVYVAPADHHLVVEEGGRLALSDAPREHHSRPSADPLFRSLALHVGAGAVAVVLTGLQADGSGGVQAVHEAGGTVLAQDPATAQAASMPERSIGTGFVDRVLALEEIAPALVDLVSATR
jgi:two-component system, chemotaxis family, protein-glutamate methylesterase/glutaminase